MLTIVNDGTTVTIKKNGVVIWYGTLSEWSYALAAATVPRRPVVA